MAVWGGVLPLLYLTLKWVTVGAGANPVRELTLFTGLWTLQFLLITLLVTPLVSIFSAGYLAPVRKIAGRYAFAYGLLHLLTFTGLDHAFSVDSMADAVRKSPPVIIGMVAFFTMAPLMLTSNAFSVKRLGYAGWKRLHRLVYLTAMLGSLHFLFIVKKDIHLPLLYGLAFLLLMGWRVWQYRKKVFPLQREEQVFPIEK